MRLSTGLIAGSIIGAVGLSYALSDKRTRRRMTRDGRRIMRKTNGLIDNISEMF